MIIKPKLVNAFELARSAPLFHWSPLPWQLRALDEGDFVKVRAYDGEHWVVVTGKVHDQIQGKPLDTGPWSPDAVLQFHWHCVEDIAPSL